MAQAGQHSLGAGYIAGAVAGLAALVMAGPAAAGAFGLREQSATAQGQSFAGAASGSGGLSSMYWNPATITMSPGFTSQVGGSLIDLDAVIRPTTGTSPLLGTAPSGGLGELAIVPSSYTAIQMSERLWLGLSTNAPYGLVTKPNYNWAGQIYARTSRIYTAAFNPVIGYKVTDWLSVAVGPDIEYFNVRLKRASSFVANAPSAIVTGDNVNVGLTAGATLTPVAGTVLGVGYRSSVHHELDGLIRSGAAVIPIRANLNTPDQITAGLTQSITPDFRLNVGYEWTNWSRLGTIAYVGPTGPVTNLPLNYRDGHFVSFGGEYDIDPRWTLRAGAAYEVSPVREAVRSPAVPDGNRVWASLGASYRWSDKLTLDVAYSRVIGEAARIRIAPGSAGLVSAALPGVGIVPLSFVANVDGDVNIVSASLRYRWDDPRVAEAAPIVRKY